MSQRIPFWLRTLVVLVVLAAPAACNRSETPEPLPPADSGPDARTSRPVSVVNVQLGRAVGADKRVTVPADSFAPTDTIYASVDTQGTAPSATLTARWTYQDGQAVHEESQTIAPNGPATTEFHVSKPDGWPQGTYTVEILLDGVSARTASFRVT